MPFLSQLHTFISNPVRSIYNYYHFRILDLEATDEEGRTALHRNIEGLDSFLAKIFLNEDDYKKLKLRGLDRVRALIQAGANVHARDAQGRTPLHCAATYPEFALVLIEAGAPVNALDDAQQTPLKIAAQYGTAHDIATLLNVPAIATHPNTGETLAANNNRCLKTAAEEGNVPLIKQLLVYPEVLANVTVNDNLAWRIAGYNVRLEAAHLLYTIPAVRAYEEQRIMRKLAENSAAPIEEASATPIKRFKQR